MAGKIMGVFSILELYVDFLETTVPFYFNTNNKNDVENQGWFDIIGLLVISV